jgi:hypothetical protein
MQALMSASSLWQSFLIMNLSAAEVGIATIDAFQWLNDQQSHRTFNPNPLRGAPVPRGTELITLTQGIVVSLMLRFPEFNHATVER